MTCAYLDLLVLFVQNGLHHFGMSAELLVKFAGCIGEFCLEVGDFRIAINDDFLEIVSQKAFSFRLPPG